MSNTSTPKRFTKWQEVPMRPFAMIPSNHPDLELIKKAHQMRGYGLGIDY